MTISYSNFTTDPRSAEGVRAQAEVVPLLARAQVKPSRSGLYRNFFKRFLDVSAVLCAAPIILPAVLVSAALVAREGGLPFYSQIRVGRNGSEFRIWKLRSMVSDADARMEKHLESDPLAREEWDSTQKLKDDPRITKVGKTLRKYSLDELPQLWNVLIGDMSLVGPRPMMTSQQELYPGKGYYALRPGITGYWQTSGRNRTTFEARAEFDDAYEAEVSMVTDIKVLLATVGVVVKGTGC